MTSSSPRVNVASPYRFHVFELARQLALRKALGCLYTAMPRGRVPEVAPELVRSRGRWAIARHVAPGIVDRRMNRFVLRAFDRWAMESKLTADVLIALSATSTETLVTARSRGVRTVCDRGSQHILEQKRILDEEADRWAWPPVPIDPWIVERELQDYDVADRISVPSSAVFNSFVRAGVDPSKLWKIPYGVDIRSFAPPAEPGDPLRVVSVAAVGLQKGHQYLLPAYASVRRPGSSLVLVGSVPRGSARRFGTNRYSDVVLMGAVSRMEVADQLRASGVFVLASVQEGLALVIAQAMACGLPVIATDATGAEELISDGVEGFIVPARDTDALARTLDRLLSDVALAREMGRAGRARVALLGGWDTYGSLVHTEIKRLMST